MKISDIKNKDLKLLAEFRHLEYVKTIHNSEFNKHTDMLGAFKWDVTIEGYSFWVEVNKGNIPYSFKELETKEVEEERDIREVLTEMGVEFYIK